jgi:acetyl coenzyme A synthetase (ADP forming)-like protein
MPPTPATDADVLLRDGTTIHVRSIAAGDVPVLRSLLPLGPAARAPAGQRPFPFELDAREVAELGQSITLVAETSGSPVAVASCWIDSSDPSRAEIRFAIVPALVGRGIGTKMLELLAREAWNADVRTFYAWVRPDDEALLRMLTDSGFTTEHRLEEGSLLVTLSLLRTPAYEEKAAERSEEAATASMKAFFEPRTVAVVGAARERGKIGSEVLNNLRKDGYTGRLVAVHPSAKDIAGVPAYPRITDVPGDVDLAVIVVPARAVMQVIDDCIDKAVRAIVIITAGFAETGPEGRALEAELLARLRRAGIRMVGPNCMGLANTDPAVSLNATFAPVSALPGSVAMSTQSGALGLAILDYARELNIGLSTFVSVGNKADVSSNDLIQYWAGDPRTRVILLYVESFGNPRKFAQIARRVGRRKPIIAVKSGRSTAGARAASSHTGALASRDVIVDALFRQSGVIRTETLEELFDVAMLLAHQPIPRGNRVAIVTNAGGPGILAADACEAHGLTLPTLSDATLTELRSFLPREASVGNPVDMIASASAANYERTLRAVLADEGVDSVLVIFIPPLVTAAEDVAAAVKRAAETRPDKTVAAIFMSAKGATSLLAPIPSFQFPEAAAVALARAAEYGAWRAHPLRPAPDLAGVNKTAVRDVIARALSRGAGWLNPDEIGALMSALGVPMAGQESAATEDAAAAAAARIGYPVVLKALGEKIVHKTELGAVLVDLRDEAAVREGWRNLRARLGSMMTGALIQEMVSGGAEMLAGIVDDPSFGPVVALASGGTRAEVFADSQFRFPPLTEDDAAAMIEGLRSKVLLRGFRGAAPADERSLRDVLLRLSVLAGWCPEIEELDINPLIVTPAGARSVDVRIRIAPISATAPSRRVRY